MEGFVLIGKAKTVFATLKILAELEWQLPSLLGLLYGKVIKLEEVKNGNQTQFSSRRIQSTYRNK